VTGRVLLGVGMILGSPCWGVLSDRLFKTRKWVIVAGCLGTAMSVIVLAAISTQTPFSVLALLFFSFGFFNATGLLMYTHIKELMPSEMSGAAMTGINFFTMIGPAVFLLELGTLMQTLYPEASRGPNAFNAVFVVCLFFLLMVALLYGFTGERRLEG
jgi:MFS family permease